MRDYYGYFLVSVVVWITSGLFFEFMFRRSKVPHLRSARWKAGVTWIIVTGWMIYNLVMWRRFP